MTNVGEVTGPRTRSPVPIPWTSVVLPAPRGPASTTTSPARSSPDSRSPSSRIWAAPGTSVRTNTAASLSGRAEAVPAGPPAVRSAIGRALRKRSVHQPGDGGVDLLRAFEYDDMPGAVQRDELGAAYRVRDLCRQVRVDEPVPVPGEHQHRHRAEHLQRVALLMPD